MASPFQKFLEELNNQKEKYHEKLLSADGELSTFMRTFQIYDFILDISALLIPEFYYSTMSLGLLFDFDLTFIEPLNLEFLWRIPTLEEWLKGIGVVIEKTIHPYATDIETFVVNNVKYEYQKLILETRLEKGYYGKSKYGYCYFDPANVREFLRNAITLMFKKHPNYVVRKNAILSLAKAFDVPEDLVRYIHDRMSLIQCAHTDSFILDYGVIDESYLCVEESPQETYYVNLDGEVESVEINTLTDLQFGFILDFSMLDIDYLCEEEDMYKDDAPVIIPGSDEKLRNLRDRIMITAPAFSNYVRGDEAVDHYKCERTNIWGELMAMRYIAESEVDQIISKEVQGINEFEKRKYITAVLQLIGHVGKRHRWGYKVFKLMSEDELKRWWIDYWVSQGLDQKVLDKLFESMKIWLPDFVYKKVSLGRKLRLERLGIPIE
jgi:hypothetical protein